MNQGRRLWIGYLALILVERVQAHALIHFDAAGHLLSTGQHTSIGVVLAVASFVVFRVVVWGTWPVALALMLLDARRTIAERRALRSSE